MAENTKDKADRSLIQGGEDHNVRELAVTAGIPVDEAEELVEKHGDNHRGLAEDVAARQQQTRNEK